MSNDLVTLQDQNAVALMGRAKDVAGVCAEIVKRTAKYIQGRKYVQVEGWQSIAAAYGCVASSRDVQRLEHGFRAIGELRRVSDGQLIASAEGYVGDDEPTWFGGEMEVWDKELRKKVTKSLPKRADYAIQAMAQTRSISRVCRSAFAFVVVLIDSKLSTTPAEEMMGIHDTEDDAKLRALETESPASQVPPEPAPSPSSSANAGGAPVTRDATLTDLCARAKVNKIDLLAKADVKHADEMSDQDWREACAMLNRKISRAAKAELPGQA